MDGPVSDILTSLVAWDHVLAILSHRYFERRWTVQELAVDKKKVLLLLEQRTLLWEVVENCGFQVSSVRHGLLKEFDAAIPAAVKDKIRTEEIRIILC